MDKSIFIVAICMGKSVKIQRVKGRVFCGLGKFKNKILNEIRFQMTDTLQNDQK